MIRGQLPRAHGKTTGLQLAPLLRLRLQNPCHLLLRPPAGVWAVPGAHEVGQQGFLQAPANAVWQFL